MFEYLKGKITDLTPASLVVECNGVGYFLTISLNSFSGFSGKTEILVYSHFHVREDAQLLFGFASKEERELFRSLILVNGIGVNTAIMMLSSVPPDELREGILREDVALLKSIKGIGAKTAQRIIIDLKDKISKTAAPVTGQIFAVQDNTIKNEALSALVMLGFNKKAAEKELDKQIREHREIGVEELIKVALKGL